MNVLLDYQIILLPKRNYWKWVRACSKYVIQFGANLTDDPESAISYMAPGQVITFPAGKGVFREHDEIEAWLQEAAPGIRLDAIDVKSPKEFKHALKVRRNTDDRYGQKQRPFYLVWPTDYPVVTQPFGANPQIYRRFGMPGHEGLDIRALTNTNVYCCAKGTVYEVHTNPKDHPYGIHVRVRHKDGFRTIYGHLARAEVRVGESVQAGQILGKADSSGASTAAHLHLTLERDGATARKETKYPKDVLDPTPYMVWPDRSIKKSLPSAAWPAGRCLIGAFGREGGGLSERDLEMIATAKLEAVMVDGCESPENIASLREIRPGMLIAARLTADLSGDPVSPKAFVECVADDVQRLAKAGVSYFGVSDHPNLQSGGWGRSWHSGQEFEKWFGEVLARLRKIAKQARFGFPGLVPGGDVVGWRCDSERFLVDADAAVADSDWVGLSYFGDPAEAGWERELSRMIAAYRSQHPSKPLFVTQFGTPDAQAGESSRGQGLLAFYRRLRNEPGVAAALCYALAPGPEEASLGWHFSEGRSAGIAEAVGSRAF
jgi:murein DD-endopeptidase MepM/ murein hydrolase activator NlpD